MQDAQVEAVVRSLRRAPWLGDLKDLARSLRVSRTNSGRLLVVGPPDDEPWHFTAHLESLARWHDLPGLTPTLVRGEGLVTGREDTVLVIAESPLPARRLEQLDDARRDGTTLFGLLGVDDEATSVTHESVVLDPETLHDASDWYVADFELATHVFGLSAAGGEARGVRRLFARRRPSDDPAAPSDPVRTGWGR